VNIMDISNPYQSPLETNLNVGNPPRRRSICWLLFSFDGRIPRKTFWFANLALFLIPYVIAFILTLAIRYWFPIQEPKSDLTVFLLVAVLGFPWAWMYFAIQVKRWHDRNKSTYWIAINLIPLLGPIWIIIELGFFPRIIGPNEYGPDQPKRPENNV
jgi:uncharacterized membrane protein YhaH (DUF805 family)